jgi:hypothetical protein
MENRPVILSIPQARQSGGRFKGLEKNYDCEGSRVRGRVEYRNQLLNNQGGLITRGSSEIGTAR